MYEICFDVDRRPFGAVPQCGCYFPGTAIEDARVALSRCIEQGQGAGMVVGPAGTGKTLLSRVLAEQFKDAFAVAVLSGGRLSSRQALLQAILYRLGKPYRGMDEGELRLALDDHLTNREECPSGILLLVDDAHTLPLRLLDEIRMLTDVAADGRPLVRVVLVGSSSLEERFTDPKLESFAQRLVARCYLESLNRAETREYIHARIERAGGDGEELFPTDSCEAVYRATDGVPRLINQVCEHALLLAHVAGHDRIETNCIQEAWADLQQLPTPWSEDETQGETGATETGVIEFGDLDDQDLDDRPEETSAPTLRISPDLDDPDPTAEPQEQLDRIEGMLAEAEDDFQPAGTIGPELELVFPDPFDEPFEEEELVAPRAATTPSPVETPAIAEETAEETVEETVPAIMEETAEETVEEEDWPQEETASIEFGDLKSSDGDQTEPAPQQDAVPRPALAARGRQYARLFATLRHG
ncbi:MAG: AAA family ATPase [Candidatus Nealsonbacteria bacterium]|nr:AAA family ATPase [Candidatus Nealsonbacteria bacterium]